MGIGAEFYGHVLREKKAIMHGLLAAAEKKGPPVLTEHLYKAGQTIFYTGNEPFGVYFIHHGLVKLMKTGKAGRMHITYMGGAGDLFGYRALLAGELYKITAESHHHAKVSFIQRDFFLDYLRKDKDLSHFLLKTLSIELGDVEDRLVGAAQVSAEQRVARVLCFLLRNYGLEHDGLLKIELSRTDMSELSDTAAETLMRCLSDLEKRKMIKRDGKGIRILKEQDLQDEAGLS
ncbi:MAG TPA: Crp/Fnr family transcriptional regulator [bacterium]|jgi:CRP-like cAMP-binding protein|nr:Crp/Fnr family transcriptional regulator [bacterium]